MANSIIPLLRGQITPDVASRRLFGVIADPVKFAEIYFEQTESDRTQLPGWMREFGANFQTHFVQLRKNLEPLLMNEFGREQFEEVLTQWPDKLGKTILQMAGGDTLEFGLDPTLLPILFDRRGFVDEVAASHVAGRVLTAYIRQIIGLSARNAKIEHSFGGDLVHALYLPHVDLWRADRRFAALVATAVPRYADRVITTLASLPEAIDSWHSRAAGVYPLKPSGSA